MSQIISKAITPKEFLQQSETQPPQEYIEGKIFPLIHSPLPIPYCLIY
ncbi:hypothetical protein [Cyanobacterium stanieri]|nr:hypothetical protein [Cyanobacterium stanieri]